MQNGEHIKRSLWCHLVIANFSNYELLVCLNSDYDSYDHKWKGLNIITAG